MEKIPTAEEFLLCSEVYFNKEQSTLDSKLLIEFAKLHVEAALEAASQCVGRAEGTDFELKDEYPLENIK